MTPSPAPGAGDGWQPAIREVVTDHEALGRVYFERDDAMELDLCDAFGLFFLDVETGSVEGWTWDAQILPSPGNRFVYLPSNRTPMLYDRLTQRSYTWDRAKISLVREIAQPQWHWGTYTNALLGWGTGSAEHLVFRSGTRYAVVDASLEAVAWFELHNAASTHRWWAHPDGTHLLRRSAGEDSAASVLYSVDLEDGRSRTVALPALEGYDWFNQVYVASTAITVVSRSYADPPPGGQPLRRDQCSMTRYDWSLTLLSEASVSCAVQVSPDGNLFAAQTLHQGLGGPGPGIVAGLNVASIFESASGAELVRLKGALLSGDSFGIHSGRTRWLADSSGLVLDTTDDVRLLGVDGSVIAVFPIDTGWGDGLVIPARDDPALVDRPLQQTLRACLNSERSSVLGSGCVVLTARASDVRGHELVSARIALHVVPGSNWGMGSAVVGGGFSRTSWGLRSEELRIHLVEGGPLEGGDFVPALPLLVDLPPFARLTALEVDASESCAYLRESGGGRLECLPHGTVVDSVVPAEDSTPGGYDYPAGYVAGGLAYVRTEDGTEGWLPIENLRWAE